MQTIYPEKILREHISSNKQVNRKGELLIFSDNHKLKIDTPTAFKQKSTGKQYSIGSVWLYLKYKQEPLSIYMNECRKEKIDPISTMDKDSLVQYFIHGVEDIEIYDKELAEKTVVFLGKKREGEDVLERPKSSKHQNLIDQNPKLRILECLFNKEKQTLNRNTYLRSLSSSLSFESLLTTCRKTFMRSSNDNKSQSINLRTSFLDELLSGECKIHNKFSRSG